MPWLVYCDDPARALRWREFVRLSRFAEEAGSLTRLVDENPSCCQSYPKSRPTVHSMLAGIRVDRESEKLLHPPDGFRKEKWWISLRIAAVRRAGWGSFRFAIDDRGRGCLAPDGARQDEVTHRWVTSQNGTLAWRLFEVEAMPDEFSRLRNRRIYGLDLCPPPLYKSFDAALGSCRGVFSIESRDGYYSPTNLT
jgi:hypothetical protein